MKNPTIKDVASKANVSISSVSRYLNRTESLAKEKILVIEEAIFELGFEHRNRKNSPMTKRTMQIGLIVPTYDSSHVIRMTTGMKNTLDSSFYKLVIEISRWEAELERKILKQFVSQKVDAVIIVGNQLNTDTILNITKKMPVLLLGCSKSIELHAPHDKILQLNVDNAFGGYLATNHLIQLGHQRIVHVYGPISNPDAMGRIEGYKRALNSAGIPFDSELMISDEFNAQIALESTLRLIEQHIQFDAIFAANDDSAYGVMRAIYQSDLKIPEDISVIGFDDLPLSSFIIPPLSTINLPFEYMGKIAIQYTLDLINGIKPSYSLPVVNLIVRDSTVKKCRLHK